jgi:hypothetical protein
VGKIRSYAKVVMGLGWMTYLEELLRASFTCLKTEKKRNLAYSTKFTGTCSTWFCGRYSTDGGANKEVASVDLRSVPHGENCMRFWALKYLENATGVW